MRLLAAILVFLLALAPAILFVGFVWMICLGALSNIFDVPNLAIGFWQAVLVPLILSIIFGGVGSIRPR